MTHATDCTVKDEWRERITEAAKRFQAGDEASTKETFESWGWEQIGAGKGRSVWRIPTDLQYDQHDHDLTSAVKESPCVLKIARGNRTHGGIQQNQRERAQYRDLPPRAKNADPPVFVPVKDSDEEGYWLSVPEAKPEGGHGVRERLFEVGMECHDLHGDNIGTMHGEPVVLDYGLDCRELDPALELAENIGFDLEGSRYMDDEPVVEGDSDSASVKFEAPEWIGTLSDGGKLSTVSVTRQFGVKGVSLAFGPWPSEEATTLEMPSEHLDDDLATEFPAAYTTTRVKTTPDDEAYIMVEAEGPAHSDAKWGTYEVKRFYEEAIESLEEHLAMAKPAPEYLAEIANHLSDGLTEVERDSGERTAKLKFWPETAPSFENRPPEPSTISVDANGFDSVTYIVGPFADEIDHIPPVTDGCDGVVDALAARYPDMDVSWFEYGSEDDRTNYAFYVSSSADKPETVGLRPDEVVELYSAIETALLDEMPHAWGPDEGEQETLDEFTAEAEIENAVAAATADGGVSGDVEAGVRGAVQGALDLGILDDRAEQQAEGFAAAMYSHVHGDGEMGRQRVNVLVAEIADRNWEGPGEVTTNHDASQVILVVEGDDIRHWDFWVGMEAAADNAPEEREAFIGEVSKTVIGSVEEVLRESEDAT